MILFELGTVLYIMPGSWSCEFGPYNNTESTLNMVKHVL